MWDQVDENEFLVLGRLCCRWLISININCLPVQFDALILPSGASVDLYIAVTRDLFATRPRMMLVRECD